METTPFYITLSAIILFLTASLVLPAYGKWIKLMEEKKAVEETVKVVNSVDTVSSLGDVGSTQHLRLNIPRGYRINVGNHSINLSREGKIIGGHRIKDMELRYHGSRQLEGNINLTVTHWLRGENFTEEKEYLIEVIP